MAKTIVVTHKNGFVGILYGKTSMSISKDGHEVLHTGNRAINTAEELYEQLGEMPQFLKMIQDTDFCEDSED